MALRASTTNSGSGTTPSVTVPAGAAIDDIMLLVVTFDNGSATISGKFPSGFTMFSEGGTTFDGQKAAVGWKRLTAADSGSYTFSAFGFSGDWICQAFAFDGRDTTNPPVSSTVNTVNTGGASPRTISANGVTAVAGDDLVWVSAPDVNATGIGNGHTPPSGYTEKQDVENLWANLSVATLENASAGATGTVSGTFAMTSGQCAYMAWLVRVPAGSGGSSFSGSAAVSGSGTLTLAGTPAIPGTAGLSGAGTLTFAGTPAIPGSAPLSGSGSLGFTAAPSIPGSVATSGSGTLSLVGTPVYVGSISLSGGGTLSLGAIPRPTGSAPLSGAGTLSLGGVPAIIASLALSGSGGLTFAGSPAITGALALSGAGTLSGSGTPGGGGSDFSGMVMLTGSGSLGTSATPAFVGLLSLGGQGVLTLSTAGSPVYRFDPPGREMSMDPTGKDFLWSKVKYIQGDAVIKYRDGTYRRVTVFQSDEPNVDIVYLGGHIHYVSDAEALLLIQAGYGEYLSVVTE